MKKISKKMIVALIAAVVMAAGGPNFTQARQTAVKHKKPQSSAGLYYYNAGLSAYKKGNFSQSSLNFEHAIKFTPENVNARYYLAQAYLMQNRISDAKNQYTRIILLFPTSEAAVLSQKGISLILKSAPKGASDSSSDDLQKYKDNYLSYIITDNQKAHRWKSFPVSVYIEPKKQKFAVQKSFEQWQEKTGNLVNFKFVSSAQNAQILVMFKNQLETTSTKESYIAGYSKPYYQGDNIIKSEIRILAVDPETKQEVPDDFVAFTALHEIGHSLGLNGHSPNPDDVMSSSASDPKSSLTQRDINTLTMFYKLNENAYVSRYEGTTDLKLQQAIEATKKTPDKSVVWGNLGDIYRGKKMYAEAIKNYQKAVSIEPDKAEGYSLLGATYLQTGDSKSAFSNMKKACDLDSSNIFYLYQFGLLCPEIGQKNVGKSYLDAFLKANPQSSSDDKIQSLLKIYK